MAKHCLKPTSYQNDTFGSSSISISNVTDGAGCNDYGSTNYSWGRGAGAVEFGGFPNTYPANTLYTAKTVVILSSDSTSTDDEFVIYISWDNGQNWHEGNRITGDMGSSTLYTLNMTLSWGVDPTQILIKATIEPKNGDDNVQMRIYEVSLEVWEYDYGSAHSTGESTVSGSGYTNVEYYGGGNLQGIGNVFGVGHFYPKYYGDAYLSGGSDVSGIPAYYGMYYGDANLQSLGGLTATQNYIPPYHGIGNLYGSGSITAEQSYIPPYEAAANIHSEAFVSGSGFIELYASAGLIATGILTADGDTIFGARLGGISLISVNYWRYRSTGVRWLLFQSLPAPPVFKRFHVVESNLSESSAIVIIRQIQ